MKFKFQKSDNHVSLDIILLWEILKEMFSKYLCNIRAHLADNHSVKFRRFSWISTRVRTGTQRLASLFTTFWKLISILFLLKVYCGLFISKMQAFGLTYLLYTDIRFWIMFYILHQWTLVESVQLSDNISSFDSWSMTEVTNLTAVLP